MRNTECPFKKLAEPRGTNGFPFVNSLPSFALNILSFLTNQQKKYGDLSQYKLMGITNYLVSHPDDIAQVFRDEKSDKYQKRWFYKIISPFFGNGLVSSFGSDWEKQRKQLQPFFSKSIISKWFPIVVEETLINFKAIDDKKHELNVEDVAKPLMQSITSRILFGLKSDNEESKKVILAIEEISERLVNHGYKSFIFNGILNKLPTPGNNKFKKTLKNIDESIDKMIENNEIKDTDALLTQFSQFMSPKELRDQLSTFYFAGQETTNSTLSWVLYYLAKFPEHQEKARNEVLSKWAVKKNINFNNLDEFVFLNAVIDESMRLAPAVYLLTRDIDQDVQLGDYKLNKDSLVMISPYLTHRHPDYWDQPTKFIPERFLGRRNKGFSFMPYGGGKRGCIGMHLARMEITTIVGLFILNFKFELKPGLIIHKTTSATLLPTNSIQLILF